MRIIQTISRWHLIAAALVAGLILVVLTLQSKNKDEAELTAEVTQGSVRETVSVSGYIEAKNTAHLSFPTVGIVTDVMVSEGTSVKKGDVLATLGSRTLVAQRSEAVASLQKAQATYDALLAGPTDVERAETAQSQNAARVSYEQTVALENEKVKNARVALLSNDLTAYAENANVRASAPTISGSYNCEDEGAYTIDTYRSSAFSGYSYRYDGLESGTDAAYTQQTAPLGDCGLTIVFTEGDDYGNTTWIIPVPNTNSAGYITYKNAYELALEARDTAVAQATASLNLADASAARANQDATSFEGTQARSTISQARAAIAAIDAQIAEKSIIAPFDGIITDVDILPGETAGTAPIITLLAEDAFSLTARIPEIDITKVVSGLKTEVVFDAQSEEKLTGVVDFVSPLATEIDGVAYFETTVSLTENPNWIRSGLNADIDIITTENADALLVPKRFLFTNADGSYYVYTQDDGELTQTPLTVEFIGNEGYAAVEGLDMGTMVAIPKEK